MAVPLYFCMLGALFYMVNIDKYLLVVRSATNAMRGQQLLLQRGGIVSNWQRNPYPSQNEGCGYALKVKAADLDRALQILSQAGIPVSEIREV